MDLSQDELFLFDPTLAEDVANLGLDDLGDLGVDLAEAVPPSPPVSPRKVQQEKVGDAAAVCASGGAAAANGSSSKGDGGSSSYIDPLPSSELPSAGHVVGSDDQFLDAGLDIPAVQHQLLESCSPSVFADTIPANPRPFPPIEKAHIPFFNGGSSFFSDGSECTGDTVEVKDVPHETKTFPHDQTDEISKLPAGPAGTASDVSPVSPPLKSSQTTPLPPGNTAAASAVPCHVPSCRISPNAGIEAAHKATALLKASIPPKKNTRNDKNHGAAVQVAMLGDGRLSPAARAVQLPVQDNKKTSPASLAVQSNVNTQVNGATSNPPSAVFSCPSGSAPPVLPVTSHAKPPVFLAEAVSSGPSSMSADGEDVKRRRRAHRKDILQQKKLQNRRKKALNNHRIPAPVRSQSSFPVSSRFAPPGQAVTVKNTAAAKEMTEIAQKLLQSISSVQDPKLFFANNNKPGVEGALPKAQPYSPTSISGGKPDFVPSGNVPLHNAALPVGAKQQQPPQQLPVIPSLWRSREPTVEVKPSVVTSDVKHKKVKTTKSAKKTTSQVKNFGSVVEKNGKKRRCNAAATPSTTTSHAGSASDAQVKEEEERLMAEANLPEGTDAESRRQRRLIRNRLSAALHRKRKRETLDNQKKMIEERDDIITDLKQEVERYIAKCDRLEKDMNALTRYFGETQISQILQRARSGAMLSDSPPHLVNVSTSGSDQSTCSEGDADAFTSSPPMSPEYNETTHVGVVHGTSESTADARVSSHPKATHVVEGGGTKGGGKKKRNLTVGLYPALATMAMCGILGRVALPPGTMVIDPSQQQNMHDPSAPVVVLPAAPEGRRRLQVVSPEAGETKVEEDSANGVKERRAIERWSELNVEMIQFMMNHDEESNTDNDGNSSSTRRPWAISPIEMYPSLWTVDEGSGTPWTVKRSYELFDFRALTKDATTTVPNSSLTAVTLPLHSPASRLKMPADRVVTTLATSSNPVGSTASSRASLRGAVSDFAKGVSSISSGENREDGNGVKVAESNALKVKDLFSSSVAGKAETLRSASASSSDASSQDGEGGAAEGEGMTGNGENGVMVGSSYMFCPAASAFFSTGFLELAGLTGPSTAGVFPTGPASGKGASNGKFKTGARGSPKGKKEEEPRNKTTTVSGLEGQHESDGAQDGLFGSNFFSGGKNTEEESTSTALVPTYLEYYRKKFFSGGSGSNASSGFHRAGNPIVKTVLGGDDPYMVILLPSSSIAGSGVSANASNGQGEDGHGQGEKQQKWIELGCQIRSARVVEGVSFAGDPSAMNYPTA